MWASLGPPLQHAQGRSPVWLGREGAETEPPWAPSGQGVGPAGAEAAYQDGRCGSREERRQGPLRRQRRIFLSDGMLVQVNPPPLSQACSCGKRFRTHHLRPREPVGITLGHWTRQRTSPESARGHGGLRASPRGGVSSGCRGPCPGRGWAPQHHQRTHASLSRCRSGDRHHDPPHTRKSGQPGSHRDPRNRTEDDRSQPPILPGQQMEGLRGQTSEGEKVVRTDKTLSIVTPPSCMMGDEPRSLPGTDGPHRSK